MKVDLFNTEQSQILKRALQSSQQQYRAIATNIANVNNESFQRVKTDFSHRLTNEINREDLKITNPKHIRSVDQGSPGGMVPDKENPKVNMTHEMAELAENQIRHDFAARALRRLYSGISTAIRGRIG